MENFLKGKVLSKNRYEGLITCLMMGHIAFSKLRSLQ